MDELELVQFSVHHQYKYRVKARNEKRERERERVLNPKIVKLPKFEGG